MPATPPARSPRRLLSPEKLKWALLSAALPAGVSGEALAQTERAAIAAPRPPPPPPPSQLDDEPPPEGEKVMEVATDPEHPFRPPRYRPNERREHAGCGSRGGPRTMAGLRLALGRAINDRESAGYYVRVEPDIVVARKHHASEIFSAVPFSLEVWVGEGEHKKGNAWGFGLPMVLAGGFGSPHVFFTAGGGFEWLVVDSLGKTGVGFLTPLAAAQLGLWLGSVRLSADARVIYRWQIGADDYLQKNLGGTIGFYTD